MIAATKCPYMSNLRGLFDGAFARGPKGDSIVGGLV